LAICKGNIKLGVHDQPKHPSDWSRLVPKSSCGYRDGWNSLTDFLESPKPAVFDYQVLQAKRLEMEHAIRDVTIDGKMKTLKKGSPLLLRLTNPKNAYQKERTKWEKDVELLKKSEAL